MPRVTHAQKSRFFLALAAMFQAGVPLHKAFEILSQDGESVELSQASQQVSLRLNRGNPLSAAFASCSSVFSPVASTLIKVGESTGSLPQVLRGLGETEEWMGRQGLILRSALVYPSVSLVAGLAMLLLAPPLLLRGQLELLRSSGVALPMITKALIVFSDLLRWPWTFPALAALSVLAVYGARRLAGEKKWRDMAWNVLRRTPVLGELLHTLISARFCRHLSRMLSAGAPLLESIKLAAATTALPSFEIAMGQASERIKSGSTLANALAETGYFSRLIPCFVQAGEETGTVPKSLSQLATICDAEVEQAVLRFGALLEPIVMLFIGVLVGAVVTATLLPTIQLLQVA